MGRGSGKFNGGHINLVLGSQAHPPVSRTEDSCMLTYQEAPVYSSHGYEGRSGVEREYEEGVGKPGEGTAQELQENSCEGGEQEGGSPREQENTDGFEHSTNWGFVCEEWCEGV